MKKEAEKKDRANKISIKKEDVEKIKNNSGSWGSQRNATQMVTLVGGKGTRRRKKQKGKKRKCKGRKNCKKTQKVIQREENATCEKKEKKWDG